MAAPFTADSIGTEVTQILEGARLTAADLLAQADERADRAGRDELASLRASLEERIETLGATRARLAELGDGTAARLRAAASQLAELPARLGVDMQSPDADSFDRAFEATEAAPDGPSPHLAALMKAADEIADKLTEKARRRSKELESAARREADRIGKEEPKRVARAYDPPARRAEELRREVEALNQLLGREVMGAEQSKERKQDEPGPDERRRAGRRGRRQRR